MKQRGMLSSVPAGSRQAVYGSAMASLADWVVTFREDAAEQACRVCYQWALQGMDGLHAPTVRARHVRQGNVDLVQAPQLGEPLLGGVGIERVPLAAELVAPMCLVLTRAALSGRDSAAGACVMLPLPVVTQWRCRGGAGVAGPVRVRAVGAGRAAGECSGERLRMTVYNIITSHTIHSIIL